MNYIICGSRKYENINLDKLVDSFDIIVRNNMLLPNNNYGKRNSDYQILNCHVEDKRKNNISLDKWILYYAKEFGISENHISSFYEYLKIENVQFMHFASNNTSLMKQIFAKNNLDYIGTKSLCCGLGGVAEFIKNNIKPSLVGFSLQESDWKKQQYSKKSKVSSSHDTLSEIHLIKQLHKANLIDATFCAIEDSKDRTIDSSLLSPTTSSLNILKEVYE